MATREYNMHKMMAHPNIVKLLDVFEITSTAFCTVMQEACGGDLEQLLHQRVTLNEDEAKSILRQLLSVLSSQPYICACIYISSLI